jgi:hypothetical protein
MIDIERRLMRAQCMDRVPGLSGSEMRIAAGVLPEAADLTERYRRLFGAGAGDKDLPALFVYAQKNMEEAIRRIIQAAPAPGLPNASVRGLARVLVEGKPLTRTTTYSLGSYVIRTDRFVSPADAVRLRLYLLKTFHRHGVPFFPSELTTSVASVGSGPGRGSEITVRFPLRASCDPSAAPPATPQTVPPPTRRTGKPGPGRPRKPSPVRKTLRK